MVFTPTDPTKAEVRTTQNGTQLEFDFYIPRGAKGEPGGFAPNAVAQTTNLNDVIVPGLYSVSISTTAPESALRNLPTHIAGTLMVTTSQVDASIQIQTYTTNTQNIYVRRRFNSSWNSWRSYAATRVDQTAGRAIYTWDELNQRDQLVWADTGWRDIATDATYGIVAAGDFFGRPSGGGSITASDVRLRRINNVVYVGGQGALQPKQDYSNSTRDIIKLPPGFRSTGVGEHPVCRYGNNGGDAGQRLVFLNPGAYYAGNPTLQAVPLLDINWNGRPTGEAYPKLYHGIWLWGSWTTADAWPTTLPGVASGSIPNA